MQRKLLIIGAGGHGKIVADAAEQLARWDRIEFIDERYPEKHTNAHWPVVGTMADLAEMTLEQSDLFIAVGANRTRTQLIEQCRQFGCPLPPIIHPTAYISRYATLGESTFIAAHAVVQTDARLGAGVIVNTGASVDHDCVLDDGVHVSPGARLAGDVQVGARSWIGIGSSVIQGVRIGNDVTIGGGSVVIRDVAADSTVVGVPGKKINQGKKG